jgi:hypothetical protein
LSHPSEIRHGDRLVLLGGIGIAQSAAVGTPTADRTAGIEIAAESFAKRYIHYMCRTGDHHGLIGISDRIVPELTAAVGTPTCECTSTAHGTGVRAAREYRQNLTQSADPTGIHYRDRCRPGYE